MPRIPDNLLGSVVYLYPTRKEAREGKAAGGTAFYVVVFDGKPEQMGIGYLATCRHLTTRHRTWWVRVNSRVPHADPIITPIRYNDWTRSRTDDLAVLRYREPIFAPMADVEAFPLAMALRKEECSPDKYGIGDDLFLVGRFIRAGKEKANVPTARFGHISAMPGDPISYNGNHYKQSGFLVEASVIGGYSGSPVWVYRTGPSPEEEPLPGQILPAGREGAFAEQTRLLGVLCAVFPDAGMALVAPAWKLVNLFNNPALRSARQQERRAFVRAKRPRRGGRGSAPKGEA